jgi:AcrR family transcriptional regulator
MEPNPTRDRILDAALQVIAQAGACRMTLDAVAEAAGVSKGGLLYHFPDKEALLRNLLDRHLDRRQHWMEQHRTGDGLADAVHARIDLVRMPETAPGGIPPGSSGGSWRSARQIIRGIPAGWKDGRHHAGRPVCRSSRPGADALRDRHTTASP